MGAPFLRDVAAEKVITVADPAAATVTRAREPFAHSGQGRHQLEGRARGKGAHCAVDQRMGLRLAQLRPVFRLDARNKSIRIKGGNRGHREDVAIVRVDHHDCAAPDRAERLFRDHLDPGIKGKNDVAPGLRRFLAHHAIDRAFGIAPHDPDAGLAAQIFVHRFLDVRFPFHVPLEEGELARLLPVGFIRRADVA